MENMLCDYDLIEKRLVNVKRQFLNVDSELNKQNMTSLVPSPELNYYKHTYINHSHNIPSQNNNVCLESDEYDSDCSLGSLNSLYLRLKDNSRVPNLNETNRVSKRQLQPTIGNLSEPDSASGNNEVDETEAKNDKNANINHSHKNRSRNDNICLESDEYDSDCSLGSLNSLYFRLKDNSTILNLNKTNRVSIKRLQPAICNLSKTDSFPGNNLIMKTNTSEKKLAYDKIEDTKSVKKLNTTLFYGKQKSTSQHLFTQLSHVHSFKKKFPNSKILKSRSSVCTFKYSTNKLRISLKRPKQKRHLTFQKTLCTNKIFCEKKNSIRSQLKEAVPLLQFTDKCIRKNVQNNKLYSWTNTAENLLPNKIEFITNETVIKKEDNSSLEFSYTENQLYEPNHFFKNDFSDTDDFGGTKEIENIIQTLFDKDDLFNDNETNKWWENDADYEDHNEIQEKFYILFKEFNNSYNTI